MGDVTVQYYCLHCKEYYADDQESFSSFWDCQLCPECNFPLLSKDDAETLTEAFQNQKEGGLS